MHGLVRDDTRPTDIVTRRSRSTTPSRGSRRTGGSTNGVLHLLAIARDIGIAFTIDDFERIASRTPIVVDMKPGGRFVAH